MAQKGKGRKPATLENVVGCLEGIGRNLEGASAALRAPNPDVGTALDKLAAAEKLRVTAITIIAKLNATRPQGGKEI